MAANQVTVAELHRQMRHTHQRSTSTFVMILERCYNRIVRAARANAQACTLEVPDFIFGQVPYDLAEAVQYVHANLKRNGYTVDFVFPRTLVVSWALQEEPRPPTGASASAAAMLGRPSPPLMLTNGPPPPVATSAGGKVFRNMVDYKPSSRFVLSVK